MTNAMASTIISISKSCRSLPSSCSSCRNCQSTLRLRFVSSLVFCIVWKSTQPFEFFSQLAAAFDIRFLGTAIVASTCDLIRNFVQKELLHGQQQSVTMCKDLCTSLSLCRSVPFHSGLACALFSGRGIWQPIRHMYMC